MSEKKKKLTDESPMPWGKHQGTAMANVPASYLLHFYDKGDLHDEVQDYVRENEDVLRLEVNRFKEANNQKNWGNR